MLGSCHCDCCCCFFLCIHNFREHFAVHGDHGLVVGFVQLVLF
jgi:hypothetical protein